MIIYLPGEIGRVKLVLPVDASLTRLLRGKESRKGGGLVSVVSKVEGFPRLEEGFPRYDLEGFPRCYLKGFPHTVEGFPQQMQELPPVY